MNKLKRYLDHYGLYQSKFARKVGITPNTLSLILHGKATPTLKVAYEIEKATGGLVTMHDWIEEQPKGENINNIID